VADTGGNRYRGYWRIGRKTTLSPLETAKAFGAPLLADYNSNETVDELVRKVEKQTVQYGASQLDDGSRNWGKLRLAEHGSVVPPKRESTFK
jgi:2-phosphoglycerate kinase